MLKKILFCSILCLFVNLSFAGATDGESHWGNFFYKENDSSTFGDPHHSFRFYDDGFKCTTKTARWTVVNGRQVQGRMYIHWEFKISSSGVTYTNDYQGNDNEFEQRLANAILRFVSSEMRR